MMALLTGGCLGPRHDTLFFGKPNGLPKNTSVTRFYDQTRVLTDEVDMRIMIRRYAWRGEYVTYVTWFCEDFGTCVDADSVKISLVGTLGSGVSRPFRVRILRRRAENCDDSDQRYGQYVNVDFESTPPKGKSIDPSEIIVEFRLKTQDKKVEQRKVRLSLYAQETPAVSPITH